MNFKIATAGALVALALGTGAAFAEYPDRPITLIVPWSAGGGTDATGRIIAAMLEEKLGEPVNVVNRTGGGGIVGHTAIKDGDSDGYTLGIITTEVSMYEPVGSADIAYDDYTLIGLYNADPSAVFVREDSPHKTIDDLAAAVKADPSAVQASGANFGGLNHLSWVSLVDGVGADAGETAWIPTDGAAPSLQLLASGAIDVVVSQFPEAKALIEAGEIRPLAYLGPERSEAYPDVPTANESLGIDFAIGGWRGLGAPKGIPDEATEKLLAAMNDIVASDAFHDQMGKLNYGVVWEGGPDFEAYLSQRGDAFGKAIGAAKIGQ
ncbi:tripartite tricarboxylate transporter substrate binding protein [Acuticoccus sp. MNP-M23]|uniref:Bug family tripartite tricarboxylate transporter substrate binding protein n=1 Tax=Acuticoccus sp. MNP-M23 TaxID=3072793 RepID=UPI0028165A82|nr:tripartite tricarboxylate transporter substrate binding protein [Acuticoccus sp. MNP-M23]WMS44655.1 tripartite tricarboxylate transporter substrate binding protein [Acuticoccus sp. MNP-M23]